MAPQDEDAYQQDTGSPEDTSEDTSTIPTDAEDTGSAEQEDTGVNPADVQIALQQTQQPSAPPPKPIEASPELIQSVIRAESATPDFPDGNPNATGKPTKYGTAKGLMQLIDSTGQQWHDKLKIEAPYNPYDPGQNKQIGTAYLNYLINRYHGDEKLALAAYNHGLGNVDDTLTRYHAKTYDEIAARLPPETQKYVPKILAGSTVKKNSSSNGPTIDQIASSVDTTRKGFADGMLKVISQPEFDDLPLADKLGKMHEFVKSKKGWDRGVGDILKSVASEYLEAAPFDQRPNFEEIVGAPPLVGANEDPKTKLSSWANSKTQELNRQGVMIPLLGTQLDKYFADSTQNETDAWTARNRSTVGLVANRAANYTRDLAKGAIGLPAGAVAGAARLTGFPETADAIESLPELLGKPAKDYLYVTDATGYPVQNQDGSLQTHWQSEMVQSIGMVGGAIASLGAGAYLGVGSKALAAFNVTENSLSMANGTFKSVYQQTGSLSSAYKASLFVLPAAAIGSIGEVGVLGGLLRPELKALSTYDQARFIGLALTKNAIIGGAASGGGDVILQAGEILQTGQKFSSERVGKSVVAGAVGTGIAGTVADSIIANKRFNDSTVNRQNQVAVATKQLVDFRNGLASKVVTTTKPGDIPPEIAKDLGIKVEPHLNGGSILTKESNVVENPNVTPADLPVLLSKLKALDTPSDLTALAEEHFSLNAKTDKTPEDIARIAELTTIVANGSKRAHLNDIKNTEAQIYSVLQQDPGAAPFRYDTGTKKWENADGLELRPTEFLADLLKPGAIEKVYEHDASSPEVNIIDEEVLQKTAVTPEILQAKKDEVIQHDTLIDTLKAQHRAESEVLTQVQGQHKDVVKAIAARNELKTSIDTLTQKIEALPKLGELTEPQRVANEKANSLRADLEKAKADLAAFKATNWSKLNPKEKKAVIQEGQAKGRKIQSIQAEILKNKAAVRAENLAAEKFKTQKGIDDQREALTKKLNDKKSEFDAIKDTVPPDLEAQQQKVKALSEQLDQAKSKAKTLSTELGETTKAAKEWEKTKKQINSAGNVLGAYSPESFTGNLFIRAGLSPELKATVTAHELGHAASNKIALPPDAELAVQGRLAEIKAKSQALTIPELMAEVLLPGVPERMKVSATTTFENLTPKSKNALLSKDELLANQIGAIILKRAGKNIGNYEILPEVEAALEKTRLPALPTPENTILPKTPGQGISKTFALKGEEASTEAKVAPTEQTAAPTETKAPITETKAAPIESPPTPVPPSDPLFKLERGPEEETAFSKTVRETIPGIPAETYPTLSRTRSQAEARDFVAKHGTAKVLEWLTVKGASNLAPEARIPLIDQLFVKTVEELDANPTKVNRDREYAARQLMAHKLTGPAQQMALGLRYRNTQSFADFLAVVDKSFREAGQESPVYTDFQLAELKAAYKQTEGLPDGVLRDLYTDKLFQKVMAQRGTSWPEFLSGYIRTNLLSGAGTQIINAVSGAYMGPIVTGLSHPIMGRGLIWRAMWNVKDVGFANAKRAMQGKGGYNLFGGMVDPRPIRPANYSNPIKAMGTLYDKFGRTLWNSMNAMDSFNRTLSAEGYIAKEKYTALKKQYGSDPAKFTAEVSKILLSKADKKAALIKADREASALGLKLSEADKYARAYEILRKNSTDTETLQNATDWSYTTSLLGGPANPLQHLVRGLFNAHIWDSHPILKGVRNVIEPFGRAMIGLSDFAQDFIPGNYIADKLYRKASNYLEKGVLEPRTKAQNDRLIVGQKVGIVLSALALGIARSGIAKITGDAEKQTGENAGDKATSRNEFKEFEQKGEPEYSVIFKNGFTFNYKDFPGVNAIFYGIYRMNKALDAGESLLSSSLGFYRGAYGYAVPLLGGGTLNSPTWKLINDMVAEDTTSKAMQAALSDFTVSATKMLTPASSLLRDIKNAYDTTPEESNQDLLTKVFKDIPIAAEVFGSKPALDRFGYPKTRSLVEHTPGVGRLVGSVREPSNRVWEKLRDRGIIVPELRSTVKFTKSNYLNENAQVAYETTREDRLGKAYSNSFTPDEWYAFIKATGPHVERIAEAIADSGLTTAQAQQELIKRVRAIESQAKQRYIRSGQF